MECRTTRSSVVFAGPTRIDGVDELLPAGAYDVDTDEEMIDGLSFVAWRRVNTTIIVRSGGSVRAYTVRPSDLDASIRSESAIQDESSPHSG